MCASTAGFHPSSTVQFHTFYVCKMAERDNNPPPTDAAHAECVAVDVHAQDSTSPPVSHWLQSLTEPRQRKVPRFSKSWRLDRCVKSKASKEMSRPASAPRIGSLVTCHK